MKQHLILTTLAATILSAHAGSGGKAPAVPTAAPAPAAAPDTVFGNTFFDDLKSAKDATGLPITIGAWHWFRFGDKGPGSNGYGIPGLRGTYFWSIDFDPKYKLNGQTVQEIGFHTQIRAREDGPFRPFFDNDVYPWETYGYAKTVYGNFKAGQIWKRIGLDWDGCFYGNTAYFDGYKLDPDIGVSWEHTFKGDNGFKMDAFAQYFIREDGMNGTITGGDAESSEDIEERNTFVGRIVPTWTFADQSSFALGLSGSIGQLESDLPQYDDTFKAWAVDATYTNGNFKLFGEVTQGLGVTNATRYVSGGASDEVTNYLVGASYKTGPVTWRMNYSAGFDKNPGGEQHLWLPAATIALTPNVDLYAEYVKWTVQADGKAESIFEDGFQLILNWRF
jgi:hypothetical protein